MGLTDLTDAPRFSANAPFVLCEDARPNGGGRLFRNPVEVVSAASLTEIPAALERVRAALRAGRHVAGWLSYEAGFAFEPRLAARLSARESGLPLSWFGVFDAPERLDGTDIENALPPPEGAWLSPPRPRISRAAYDAAFERAKRYIVAGDIYQINLSYRADVTLLGDPLTAYARLRAAGQGGWSALVRTEETWLLSTSPELFFQLDDGRIEARPMKGTAKRAADPAEDRRAAEDLRIDDKERAENLMIVDLLRNDISRIARKGSVHVPALFSVETYPTLHTLTSTVRAQIKGEHDIVDVLKALFPCGSITGAPKIRAMEIIDELEIDARGAYTGAIGWIAPGGNAEFNVAIRTVAVTPAGAELGLGSAVVLDSTADAEWEECRTKGAFVTANVRPFQLIETMRFERDAGVIRLDLHLARLRASAATFGFAFDEIAVRRALDEALQGASVVRLLLSDDGGVSIELNPIPTVSGQYNVALVPLPVASTDFRLRHKTTDRAFYDDARAAAGTQEVVFFDADGFITEGSFTNVFVERGGALVTPPASRGLLPGILRAALLKEGRAAEGDLRVEDLVDGFLLGNSVRGLVQAKLTGDALRKKTA